MEKGKWNGIIKTPEDKEIKPEDILDDELSMLLRTALAGAKQKRKDAPKNIPIELLIILKKKRIPIKAMARICKCTPQNIRKRLAGKLQDISLIGEYKKNRADVLAYQQRRILTSMSEKDLENAGLKDKSVSFGILYDKERLETGKSIGGEGLVVNVLNFGGGQVGMLDQPLPHAISVTPTPLEDEVDGKAYPVPR